MARRSDDRLPSVCVALIVRNESATVVRALESARGVADCWYVLDTGSTDNTVEILTEYARQFPGTVARATFHDFSQARNLLYDMARPEADWLLLMDADHEWVRDTGFLTVKQRLTADVDALFVTSLEDPHYENLRLIRTSLEWAYVGRTHEWLRSNPDVVVPDPRRVDPGGPARCVHSSVAIRHHADGGFRHDKHERDLGLLEMDVVDRPDSQALRFRLGLTQYALGRYLEAEESFAAAARLRDEDDGQIRYWVATWEGKCRLALGEVAEGERLLLTAAYSRLGRREAFHELLRSLNGRGVFDVADTLVRQYETVRTARPRTDRTFVSHRAERAMWIEAAHAALQVGNPARARDLLGRVGSEPLDDELAAALAAVRAQVVVPSR